MRASGRMHALSSEHPMYNPWHLHLKDFRVQALRKKSFCVYSLESYLQSE